MLVYILLGYYGESDHKEIIAVKDNEEECEDIARGLYQEWAEFSLQEWSDWGMVSEKRL